MTSQTAKDTKKWMDDFTIALRLREVRGTAIGDAIAAIESHCAESGESPLEAFGDAREYAASLEFPATEVNASTPIDWARTLAPTAAGLVAINLISPTVRAFFDHTPVGITWGWVAALVVMALGVLLAVRIIGALLAHWVNFSLYFGGLVAATVALGIVWNDHAFSLPAWGSAAAIVALLAASVVLMARRDMDFDDPLVDPRAQQARPHSSWSVLTSWIFVIVAIAMTLLAAIPLALR